MGCGSKQAALMASFFAAKKAAAAAATPTTPATAALAAAAAAAVGAPATAVDALEAAVAAETTEVPWPWPWRGRGVRATHQLHNVAAWLSCLGGCICMHVCVCSRRRASRRFSCRPA
jgi:hypothetical protein